MRGSLIFFLLFFHPGNNLYISRLRYCICNTGVALTFGGIMFPRTRAWNTRPGILQGCKTL
jgi:hypothetical protein